jgi:hypothetical protein
MPGSILDSRAGPVYVRAKSATVLDPRSRGDFDFCSALFVAHGHGFIVDGFGDVHLTK